MDPNVASTGAKSSRNPLGEMLIDRWKSHTARCLLVMAVGLLAIPVGLLSSASVGATPTSPSSMVAFGDSFTLGYASGFSGGGAGCTAAAECRAISWSTGTLIDSHSQRLLAANPSIAGNVRNEALLGALMSTFASVQIPAALSGGFKPQYATVMLGLGDACFATTTQSDFASQFAAGLDLLNSQSSAPNVFLASLPDLESIRSAALARDPQATWNLCQSFFNGSDAARAAISARIDSYNQALASVCSSRPNCIYDGGAVHAH